MKKTAYIFLLALTLVSPATFTLAQTREDNDTYAVGGPPKLDYSGFVKCDGVPARNYSADGTDIGARPGEEKRQRVCDFAALMDTIILAIKWAFMIAIPMAAVLLAYGGVLYMTGQKDKIGEAKRIFKSVVVGFIIMLIAWFSVRQVVSWFVDDPTATTFLGK